MKNFKLVIIVAFSFSALAFLLMNKPEVARGQGTLSAPTGVSASNGSYTTKIGINWDPIRGATSYRIFRNTTNNPNGAVDVGVTAAPYFFDASAAQNTNFFYWVRAENSSLVSDLSAAAQGLRANGTPNGPVPPLEPPLAPAGNPVTATKTALGKVLFWDEQLSSTRTVSCGTCHISGASGSDPRSIVTDPASTNPGPDGIYGNGDDIIGSPGVPLSDANGIYQWTISKGIQRQVTGRRSMPTINAAYPQQLFWDGRATQIFRDPITNVIVLNGNAALESQAAGPPVSDSEMSHVGRDWGTIAQQMSGVKPLALSPGIPAALETWIGGRSYPELFQEAFGTPEVSPARIAMAIATYERTLFSDRTPIDLFTGGANVLTQAEQRGRQVFNTTTCNLCHGGPRQTNDAFIYTGVRPQNEDLGRFVVTGSPGDRGSMKVPSLRNVELHAPYMRNGRFATLEDVVEFYNRGGDFTAPNKAPAMQPLNLTTQQKADLVAFMKRPLTDARVAGESGPFSRPVLYTESNRVPVISGSGRPGSGGNVPQVMAIEPPLVGNPSFTVAVSNSIANASAVLVVDSVDPGVGNSIPASGSFARVATTLSNTGNGGGYGSVSLAIPDNPALVGQTFFGRWYITDAAATNGFSVSQVFQFTVFGEAATVNSNTHIDFDGDRKTDISIFRPTGGEWWYKRSSDSTDRAFQFGSPSDKLVPADFTGDGKTDVAFWRPDSGEWFVLRSEDFSYYSFPFGAQGDIPVPGDYDSDGKADAAVFRSSNATWYIPAPPEGTVIKTFGAAGDLPQTGDYDGDGKTDLAVFRPSNGEWWIERSTGGVIAFEFGTTGDKPVSADYTGDGKFDVAFWRPSSGEWFILRSEDFSFYAAPFGISSDIPAPGDYDGDGKTDFAVFRDSNATWYINRSAQGMLIENFGAGGDYPVPAAYVP